MKYNTFCPLFTGFYNTIFQYDGEDEDIRYYNEENGTNYDYDDFSWDYKDYENRISKAFVNRLEKELKDYLPIKMKFQELVSPKEYNFSNDSINIEVSLSLKRLIKLIKENKDEAESYFLEKYTSCSGFISFHSNDVNDWLKESYILEKPEHRVGALLDCLCSIKIDDNDTYEWVTDEMYISFEPNEVTA